MGKRKDLKDLEKAIRITHIDIESQQNDEGVHITVGGHRIGLIYKMAFVMSELVRMEALHLEDLQYIAEVAEENAARYVEDDNEEDEELDKILSKLEEVDPEDLDPQGQLITKAIEEALKAHGLDGHMRIVPMQEKKHRRRK